MCAENKEACTMETITQNLTKSMFILMGKLTSMAETLKKFPADDEGEYEEQMRELGSDAGTFLRVVYNFETPAHIQEKADRRKELNERLHSGH